MRRFIFSLGVITIVSFALAFKTKPLSGAYCGNPIGTSGCQIFLLKKEVTGVVNFHINLGWTGCASDCASNPCTTEIRLVDQN
jgi:hypothetical protein